MRCSHDASLTDRSSPHVVDLGNGTTLSEAGSVDAAFPCVRTALARVRRVTKLRSSWISVLCLATIRIDHRVELPGHPALQDQLENVGGISRGVLPHGVVTDHAAQGVEGEDLGGRPCAGERGLARAGGADQHDQPVLRQVRVQHRGHSTSPCGSRERADQFRRCPALSVIRAAASCR